jgi:hypothetical protein
VHVGRSEQQQQHQVPRSPGRAASAERSSRRGLKGPLCSLPAEALDVLIRALLRICEDPYDRLFSRAMRNDNPPERMAGLGDPGFMEFRADKAAGLMRVLTLVWAGWQGLARCCQGVLTRSPHASALAIFPRARLQGRA